MKQNLKKVIILSAIVGFVCAGSSVLLIRHFNSAAQKQVNVAFYNIPENQAKVLQENIKKLELGKVTFKDVTLQDLNKDSAVKSYDLLFAYDGLAAEKFKARGGNISSKLFNYLPTSLRPQNEPNDRK